MNQKGFTFIELMVVVAVIGILAAMAVPKMGNSVKQQELNSAAEQMVSELRYLQQLTINSSDTDSYKMVFSANQYYLANGVNIIKTISLPSSVVISGLPSVMTFNHYDGGTPTAQTIQLRSASLNKSLYIKIHPNRGRVRVDTVAGTDS